MDPVLLHQEKTKLRQGESGGAENSDLDERAASADTFQAHHSVLKVGPYLTR